MRWKNAITRQIDFFLEFYVLVLFKIVLPFFARITKPLIARRNSQEARIQQKKLSRSKKKKIHYVKVIWTNHSFLNLWMIFVIVVFFINQNASLFFKAFKYCIMSYGASFKCVWWCNTGNTKDQVLLKKSNSTVSKIRSLENKLWISVL